MFKSKFSFMMAVILIVSAFANIQPVTSKAGQQSKHVADVIILEVKEGVSLDEDEKGNSNHKFKTNSPELDAALDTLGVHGLRPLFPPGQAKKAEQDSGNTVSLSRIYRLKLKPNTDVDAAVTALSAVPDVLYAEPDYIAEASSLSLPSPASITFTDPEYVNQWGMAKINIESAWNSTLGAPTTTIAIIDSGIDRTHVDLASNLWVNPGDPPGDSNGDGNNDDDSNGVVDDVNGWNFISANNDVSDDNGHGTLVAGVAAAVGGNAQGIVGGCPQCTIMTVKVMNNAGTANYSDIAAGILYAAQKGADVINLSVGGTANSNILQNAVNTATNTYNAVLVAGAGNNSSSLPFYPAAYDNVLAVAGTDNADAKAGTSNYGTWVDVSAPSETIRTTALGSGWVDNSGTSFASPFAAGLAGLIKTLHPDWNQATVRSQIVHTTNNIDGVNPTYTGMLGTGRLNAGLAMQTPHPILSVKEYAVNGLANGRATLNATSNLVVTLNNDWWDVTGVTGTLSTADAFVTIVNGSATFGDIPAATSKSNAMPFTFSMNSSAGYNHPINFTLNITSTSGYSTSLNFTVNTESGIVNKSGTIISNETWTSDQTYLIINNVNIPSGVTLTIQPGTTVKFDGTYNLNVRGMLLADANSSQPIFFKSNTSNAWGYILFDDTSADATADGSGNYLSGSILRYVNIESSSGGIDCANTTPYLSHVTLNSGGIACPLGATPVWFMDNTVTGGASFTGSGTAYRNIVAGGLSISGAGIAEDNEVSGGVLSLGSGTARRNIASGGLTIGGSGGTMEENEVTGNVSIGDSFSITKNMIKGSLTVGNGATVDHNTVTNGITVGSSANVTWNTVEDASGTCLTTGNDVTAQYNCLIGCDSGMSATTGLIEHNLIANNTGVGLQVGAATVQFNTLTGNAGNTILVQGGMPIAITNNNLELNSGTFDLYSNIASGSGSIPTGNNWWGVTDSATIINRIYDYSDDDLKAPATFLPVLTGPGQTAPGYVRAVNVLPDTTLGIQTGTFEVQFSKPMDTNQSPAMIFFNNNQDTWSQYNTNNSLIPHNYIWDILVDDNGVIWIGTPNGVVSYDQGSWRLFNTSNSGLTSNMVTSLAVDINGTKWFGTEDAGLFSFDGANWKTYNAVNSALPNNSIMDIEIGMDGTKWICPQSGGVARFDGANWKIYNKSNSLLPNNSCADLAVEKNGTIWVSTAGPWDEEHMPEVDVFDGLSWKKYDVYATSITIDQENTKWFGSGSGGFITSFNGIIWEKYSFGSSGEVSSIAIDSNGIKWVGTHEGGAFSFDGKNWSHYGFAPSVSTIAIEQNGTKWFGTIGSNANGVNVLHGIDKYYIINDQQWLSSTLYHATYGITSVILKDTYRVNVSDAFDPDGMRIAPFSNATFNVDYAGGISDKTPPTKPAVTAIGDGGLTTLNADWDSRDPESPITMYRYAIGTSPGARDVVGWTYTTNTSMTHAGLNLTSGVIYYVSAGARNQGGLWSEDGISNGVAAGETPPGAFAKSSPANNAISQPSNPVLKWSASANAAIYEYCLDTESVNDNLCNSAWIPVSAGTSVSLSGLSYSQKYFWQVRAVNAGGAVYADGGTWRSFTTRQELAKNGGFNTYAGTSKVPTGWVKSSNFAGTDGKDTKTFKEGTASVKLGGETGKVKTLTQTLKISGAAKNPFTFSYWVKASSMPSSGLCQVEVSFYNGTKLTGTKTLKCPTGAKYNWKQVKMNFTAPSAYTKTIIKFTYSKASGTVWFDLASLLR